MPWIVHKELGLTTFGALDVGEVWSTSDQDYTYERDFYTMCRDHRFERLNPEERDVVPNRRARRGAGTLRPDFECYHVLMRWED